MANNGEGRYPPAQYDAQGAGGYGMQYSGYDTVPSSQLSNRSQGSGSSQATRHRRGGLVSGLVRGVAAGIGLAAESYHHHQEKKKAAAAAGEGSRDVVATGHSSPPDTASQGAVGDMGSMAKDESWDDENVDNSSDDDVVADPEISHNLDEAAWQLDEAQDEMCPPPDYTTTTEHDIPAMADAFVRSHPPPAYSGQQLPQGQPHRRLPMPVILPQRRPGERARGFVQAYAPLLHEVGIDQTTFADFIRDLNKATMPSPWLNAINVASIAVQHVPEPITIAVSIAAQIGTQVALQTHSRSKTNQFIDHMNAAFFRPRGLIAVIMTWRPSRPGEVVTQVDLDGAVHIAAQSATPGSQLRNVGRRVQASHGTTHFEWPESAPLVFPALDKLAASPEAHERAAAAAAAKKPGSFVRGMNFVMEYMDNRAQATWAGENPDSRMANLAPKHEFHSRFADPNHPANSGSLVALLTGGAVAGRRAGRRQERRAARTARRELKREARGPTILGTIGPGALIRGVKKMMAEDVLYLMITNLPSEEDMTRGRQYMNSHGIGEPAGTERREASI